jgi:hypothetical protein
MYHHQRMLRVNGLEMGESLDRYSASYLTLTRFTVRAASSDPSLDFSDRSDPQIPRALKIAEPEDRRRALLDDLGKPQYSLS